MRTAKRPRTWYDVTPRDPRLWLYGRVPPGFWQAADNRQLYMDWLGEQLGITTLEDWYRLTYTDLSTRRGGTLLRIFGGSPNVILKDYRPTYDWQEWRFLQAPARFWGHRANRHRYLDWLGHRLGFKHVEDWYQISREDFLRHYGGGLLDRFGDSPSAILKEYWPDYDWLEWRFGHVPLRFWQQRANRRRYLDWLGQQLGFETRDDWYRLSAQHLAERHVTHPPEGLKTRKVQRFPRKTCVRRA